MVQVFENIWENVVIECVNLWGRACSGSRLNLCAASKRLAHNSSTDEQRADLGTAEAKLLRFLPTCRIVSGITMKAQECRQLRLGCPKAACRLKPPARAQLLSGSQQGTSGRGGTQFTHELMAELPDCWLQLHI
ncbi:hypothetical protein EYF80_002705 [Liparis tanakae]|uniref:Uncharacterized protein n=1 Tax=Liparis tanakae TaxID=230148 RepID=A0A4Z2JA13_9TELE|nr:hypothetical protein EYF80_002705 [Liparis tanakae]